MNEDISSLVEQIEEIYKDKSSYEVIEILRKCLFNFYKLREVKNYKDMTYNEIYNIILEIKMEKKNEETN